VNEFGKVFAGPVDATAFTISGVPVGGSSSTILNGSGAPSSGLGANGDFYIDNTAHAIYGPKTAGAWGSSTSLIGPAGSGSGDMLKTDNLSGLANYTTARTNMGLGGAAVLNVGTAAGTVAAGDDSRLKAVGTTAGTVAAGDDSRFKAVGTTAGTVAAGDDSRFSASSVPSGALMPYAGSSAPSGWLLSAGQAVSRSTYAALFTAISTTYGAGDGSTTFNLPDLRGRAAFGVDNMNGSTASRVTSGGSGVTGTTLGASGGAETVTLSSAQMPAHVHSGVTPSTGGTGGLAGGCGGGGSISATGDTNSTGGGGAHTNLPPTIMLNYIIKT
jgi:microcystin-dependent protein